jgi:NhaA family Na+:H+ antiporter
MLLGPLSLGIVLGLFIGKQLGIMAFIAAGRLAGLVQLPTNATWRDLYGIALLCGIGFTMSLFIGLLAFEEQQQVTAAKLAILVGSLSSALMAAVILFRPRFHDAG